MIRPARAEDAEQIREISLELTVARNSGQQGFVEYQTPPIDEMRKRIQLGIFYVSEGDRVAGFVSAFTDQHLDQLNFEGDEIVKHLKTRPRPFIYVDELGVKKNHQNKGTGYWLMRRMIAENAKTPLLGAISHAPIRNEKAIAVCLSLGSKLEEEITIYDGLTFGIYRLTAYSAHTLQQDTYRAFLGQTK